MTKKESHLEGLDLRIFMKHLDWTALADPADILHYNSYTVSTHFSLSPWCRGFNTTASVIYLRLQKETLKIELFLKDL